MRYLSSLVVFIIVVLVACSSTKRNDGKAVSELILKTPVADSGLIYNAVYELDSLVTPEIFGRDFAMILTLLAENDTLLSGKEINRRVGMLRHAYTLKAGSFAYNRFDEGVQSYIDALPVERKMRVYAAVATPEQLGSALRIERYRNPGDSMSINEQADALLKMYDTSDRAVFLKFFNR